ncbi:MAG TPA: ABC transporter permease [Phycisphaerales bacterium]|nr:ABC transporter permease [Phycisphaerales bacterium]
MTLVRLLTQTVVLALTQIWVNKVRAMLTTLGIIIAVFAIVALTAAGEGFKVYMVDQFASFGANKVWIFPDRPDDQPGRYTWRQIRLKTWEVEGLLEAAPSLNKLTPIMEYTARVEAGERVKDFVKVTAFKPDWHDIEQRYVTVGRTFQSVDDEQRRHVMLINDKGVQELNLPADPTGMAILVGDRRFTIIGVVETRSVSPMFGGGEAQTELFIPFNTGLLIDPEPRLYCVATTKKADMFEDAREEVTFYMRRVRNLGPGDPNTFGVQAIEQVIEQVKKVLNAITMFLGGVVTIALLVGGIGIMNIMLVSVSERTREIGLRKAVGAKPSVILLQFLVEAVTLCLVGCGVGLAMGFVLILALRANPDSPVAKAAVPTWAVLLAVIFSAGTGIIFGMFPAIKAARLDPIEALRHE